MIEEPIREGLVLKISSDGLSAAIVDTDTNGHEGHIALGKPCVEALQGALAKHFPEVTDYYEKGKEIGRKYGKEFGSLDVALLAVVACDLIEGQGKRQQYIDGFCAGFYEVNPVEPTGVSI